MGARKLTGIAYCRTSTVAQKESESINAQIDVCRRILERHGVRLVKYGPNKDGWLIDDGVSGSLLDGRHFATLIDDLEARRLKPPDFLIVFSLSRIGRLDKSSRDMRRLIRSHTDNARIKAVLLGSGMRVLDQDGENDPHTVMFDLKLTLSAEEYKLIRQRTMAGKAQRLSEGKFAKGGKPPYGYVQVFDNGVDRRNGWTLAPHPDDAENLCRLLGWFVEGGPTYAARKATKAGVPTPMASTRDRKNAAKDWTPTRWSPVSVQHIARNVRVYLGEQTLVFDGVPHDLKYPPLIDAALFAAVERRKKEKTLKRRAKFLSTGLVDCACGAHVHEKNRHGKHWTSCAAGCGATKEGAFSASLWDAAVSRLIQIRQHEQNLSREHDPYGRQVDAAKDRLASVQAEIDRVLDLYVTGHLDRDTWIRRNAPLAEKKAAARADVERIEHERDVHEKRCAGERTVEARIGAVLDELVEHEPTLERKRAVLSDLLQGGRVVVRWKGVKIPTITLPAFGALPLVTVEIDECTPWVRKHTWWRAAG